MEEPIDFEVLFKTHVVGGKHVGIGSRFHPREPLRHEDGFDGSNDARVLQLVGQLGADSPRVVSSSPPVWLRP
jgi:hypothetical protein